MKEMTRNDSQKSRKNLEKTFSYNNQTTKIPLAASSIKLTVKKLYLLYYSERSTKSLIVNTIA